jgi:phosphatidylserine/phosphatidylglycerophosphate/cardiolipin synthase-like enzyme
VRFFSTFLVTVFALLVFTPRAQALERICDPAFEDCRDPLIQLIDNETSRIDFAFWFLEDGRISSAVERAVRRGVKVRVIFDSEELTQEDRLFCVNQLVAAGVPMREKVDAGINHWKLMIFDAQKTVQFSGGNHTAEAFVYEIPYAAYVDEVIYFTDKTNIVNSFKTKFDDVWTSNTGMLANYANVTTIERAYPVTPIDPQLIFSPFDSFRDRSVATFRAEPQRVDSIIYRITDRAYTDALIENVQRGVGFRLITEPLQYRDESRLWHSWNVDRLYLAGQQHAIGGQPGIQIRHRQHDGLTHEKLSILVGSGISVLGTSNWSSASSDYQLEVNLFYTDPVFFAWSRAHFDRKWNNTGGAPETRAFAPLPPDVPGLASPADGAVSQPAVVPLQWHAGPWAHKYDVLLGTDPSNLVKIVNDAELGPYDIETVTPALVPGTRYYWRVVSRTMANLTATSPIRTFTTVGAAPPNIPPSVSLTSPTPGSSFTAPASVTLSANASDTDGTITRVEFLANGNVVATVLEGPFTATWSNVPAGTYVITARAWDNRSETRITSTATITVAASPTQPPVVTPPGGEPSRPPTVTPPGGRVPVRSRAPSTRATDTGRLALPRR